MYIGEPFRWKPAAFEGSMRRMDKNVPRKYSVFGDSPEDVITEVEQWSKEHPYKTRQTELLKMFPEAHVSANGSLYLCPASVSAAYRDKNGNCKVCGLKCADCRKGFWGQEVE